MTRASALCAGTAYAQLVPAPGADQDAMYEHFKKAQQIAGLDPFFAHRCLVDQTYRRTISRSIQATGVILPLKVFDNLHSVGQNAVSSWVSRRARGSFFLTP
jgi:hypothetical protein